jgi:adenylate kinase family enzyme
MKRLYIIRGIPGSGKSTLATAIMGYHDVDDGRAVHFEADMMMVDEKGEYKYDRSKLQECHDWCYDGVLNAMIDDIPVIVVSNTFTQLWQYNPYISLAKIYGYDVQEIICKGNFKSVHDVPEESMKKFRERFQY